MSLMDDLREDLNKQKLKMKQLHEAYLTADENDKPSILANYEYQKRCVTHSEKCLNDAIEIQKNREAE